LHDEGAEGLRGSSDRQAIEPCLAHGLVQGGGCRVLRLHPRRNHERCTRHQHHGNRRSLPQAGLRPILIRPARTARQEGGSYRTDSIPIGLAGFKTASRGFPQQQIADPNKCALSAIALCASW
jgi:hypothetical protein